MLLLRKIYKDLGGGSKNIVPVATGPAGLVPVSLLWSEVHKPVK